MSSRHRSMRAVLVSSGAALALVLGLVAPAFANGGGSGPTYRAVLSPAASAAGSPNSSTITLTQLVEDSYYHERELGSVRITPPAGFSLVSATATRGSTVLAVVVASGSVTISHVDLHHPGETASVSIQTTIDCGVGGDAAWAVVVHQTDYFTAGGARVLGQDPSSQVTSHAAACSLAFVAGHQPTAGGVGQTISGDPGNPSGPPVQVQLRNGNGGPAAVAGVGINLTIASGTGATGAVLGGSTSSNTGPTGLAAFAPSLDLAGRDYQLRASAGAGIGSATSVAFNIDDLVKTCSGACSGTTALDGTTATVSTNTNGVLTMSLGLDGLDCNNAVNQYYVSTSEVLSFAVSSGTARKTITIKLDHASVTKPFFKYEVCFSSPNTTFVNKYGSTIAAGAAGILPWCKNCSKPSGGPCVVAKWFDLHGNVFVRFSVPMADPRGRI